MSRLSTLVPRHFVDIEPADLAFALARAATPASDAARRIASVLGEARDDARVVCLSVRSGFDLVLTALALPVGSEVLVTAINIPDMARLLRAHGLVAVPVDLDPGDLTPDPAALARAVGPRTRAILVAHLFGARTDLSPYFELARRHGLVVLEDGAQAFHGPSDWGDARALVSMWSFGTIKTATALGGGVLVVRDEPVARRVRALHAAWPVQPRRAFARKTATLLALAGVRAPGRYAALVQALELAGGDVERLLAATTRGFAYADDADLLRALRHRPSPALLALLARRLSRFDAGRLARRRDRGEQLVRAVTAGGGSVLGGLQRDHTHWLVPVCARSPQALVGHLRRAGFDATGSATSLGVFQAPEGREPPTRCRDAMARVVYVPAYPEIPEDDFARLVAALSHPDARAALGG